MSGLLVPAIMKNGMAVELFSESEYCRKIFNKRKKNEDGLYLEILEFQNHQEYMDYCLNAINFHQSEQKQIEELKRDE